MRSWLTFRRTVVFLACMGAGMGLHAQALELVPMVNSVGIRVSGAAGADSCQFQFRIGTSGNWHRGYPPDRALVGDSVEFRGSIFPIDSGTSVDVRACVWRGSDSLVLPVSTVMTRPVPVIMPSTTLRYVSPNGSGNEYTRNRPGSLTDLFRSGSVSCGMTVILLGGIYRDRDLQLELRQDCSSSMPITLMADGAAEVIIDGGMLLSGGWTRDPNDTRLFRRPLPPEAAFSTLCVLADSSLYPYPSLQPEILVGGYGLTALNFGADGFVRDGQNIWIKTADGRDPNTLSVSVSVAHRFMTVLANGHDANLRIKGLRFRHFGKPVLNPLGSEINSLSAVVLDLRDIHHVMIDDCRFLHNSAPIMLTGSCRDYVIQNCEFTDDVGRWTHAMIKMSLDFIHTLIFTIESSRGRRVETSGIFVERSSRGVIRNCRFTGLNSGIESSFDRGLNQEVDVYGNTFTDCFDAVECDGYWTNLRVWKNVFAGVMAGISAAPPLLGPRYVYRNVFTGLKGRRSELSDPYFVGCQPAGSDYRMQAVAVKTNSSYVGKGLPGDLHVINNTIHAVDTLGFVLALYESEWRNARFVNNAYSHDQGPLMHYFSLGDTLKNQDFQIASIRDNYFTYAAAAPLATIDPLYGSFRCVAVGSVDSLQSRLRVISQSPLIVIDAPGQSDPGFVSPSTGRFDLTPSSPLINAGVIVDGFTDFAGTAPDVGAIEFGETSSTLTSETVDQIRAFPNPASDLVELHVPEMPAGFRVDVYDCTMQRICSAKAPGAFVHLDLSMLSVGTYTAMISDGVRLRWCMIVK